MKNSKQGAFGVAHSNNSVVLDSAQNFDYGLFDRDSPQNNKMKIN